MNKKIVELVKLSLLNDQSYIENRQIKELLLLISVCFNVI